MKNGVWGCHFKKTTVKSSRHKRPTYLLWAYSLYITCLKPPSSPWCITDDNLLAVHFRFPNIKDKNVKSQ